MSRPVAAGAPPWIAPAALLAIEFVALSVFIEFPETGPARPLVRAALELTPVVIGGGAAALLIGRLTEVRDVDLPTWPGGRPPALALALQLAAFAGSAALGYRLMGPQAEPVAVGGFLAWLGTVAVAFATGAALIGPPVALARRAARALAAPVLAIGAGLLSWRAVAASEALWQPLRGATLTLVAALLRAASGDVHLDAGAAVIGIAPFHVEIAPECSGVDGIGLVLLFQGVWVSLAASRVRTGRALLVLAPAGLLAAFLANVVRITVLVLVGAAGHADLALGAFHSKLGWVLFLVIAFVTIAAAEHVRWLQRQAPTGSAPVGVPPEAAAHLAPLVTAIAVGLVTSMGARDGLDPLYGLRVLAAGIVLARVRRQLAPPSVSFSWVALLVGAAVGALWIAWGGAPGSSLGQALSGLDPGPRLAWIAVRVAGGCLVIPVVEELAFRGFLLPWLATSSSAAPASARAWPWSAMLLSSLAFGALHADWILGTVAGVAFAFARARRGRLSDAVTAHAVANAALALAALLGGRWDLLG